MGRMAYQSNSGMPPAGPVTKALLILAVGASVANGLLSFVESLIFVPAAVLSGQVWRLVTYPWIAPGDVFGFLLSCLMIYMFGAQLELQWGAKRYARRVAVFVIAPAVLTVLVSFVFPSMAYRASCAGLAPLTYALVASFASLNRHRRFFLFPLPFEVSGDGLLIFDAACLGLAVLLPFSQTGIGPHLTSIAALGLAVVWFRLDVVRDLRHAWLRLRQRQIESRLARMRARRNLRIVSSDDSDEEQRRSLLH
jgi:membrane associated rhomboid family serine protease